MNVFDRASSRWRKNRKRGVSPIIATILLVAITVVLAAVLYVLIAGLTHTGASTPYTIGMQAPSQTSPAAGVYWNSITISPQTGVTTAMFGLALSTSTNLPIAVGAAPTTTCKGGAAWTSANCGAPTSGTWYAVLYGTANSTVANVFSSNAWTGSTVGLTSAQTLVVVSGAALAGSLDVLSCTSAGSSVVTGSSGSF